ncbi:hypothetical protein PGT21_023414 [Puccinia graminis f. sp. tritici]|uniref:Uncharacterized protein n=1 Tax=Puccinia graminis f. sp. tritici TaxID=56615 RepID=A0A5B0QWV7_PUCGR|nr:hypothetical protein PGT21_023414 [Puccinia graminis f. sp. tritici]
MKTDIQQLLSCFSLSLCCKAMYKSSERPLLEFSDDQAQRQISVNQNLSGSGGRIPIINSNLYTPDRQVLMHQNPSTYLSQGDQNSGFASQLSSCPIQSSKHPGMKSSESKRHFGFIAEPEEALEIESGSHHPSERDLKRQRSSDHPSGHTHSQSSGAPSVPAHEALNPRPNQAIKLLGFVMSPGVTPSYFSENRMMKNSNRFGLSALSEKTDESNKDVGADKMSGSKNRNSRSARSPETPLDLSIEPRTRISVDDPNKEMKQSLGPYMMQVKPGWKRLKFDEKVLTSTLALQDYPQKLQRLLELMKDRLGKEEMRMTETEFLNFHSRGTLKLAHNRTRKDPDTLPANRKRLLKSKRTNSFVTASTSLYQNRKGWYQHWWEQGTKSNLESLIEDQSSHLSRQRGIMILQFLAYVEMISTIVINPHVREANDVGFQLEKAIKMVEELFDKEKVNCLPKTMHEILLKERRIQVEEQISWRQAG